MKAHIEVRWLLGDQLAVYIFDRNWLYKIDQGNFVAGAERKEYVGQDFPEPTFTLPREALEALLMEAGKVIQTQDATVDALNDTRMVRDRLLALVEKLSS